MPEPSQTRGAGQNVGVMGHCAQVSVQVDPVGAGDLLADLRLAVPSLHENEPATLQTNGQQAGDGPGILPAAQELGDMIKP